MGSSRTSVWASSEATACGRATACGPEWLRKPGGTVPLTLVRAGLFLRCPGSSGAGRSGCGFCPVRPRGRRAGVGRGEGIRRDKEALELEALRGGGLDQVVAHFTDIACRCRGEWRLARTSCWSSSPASLIRQPRGDGRILDELQSSSIGRAARGRGEGEFARHMP